MEEERVKKFIKAYEEIKEQSFIIANINKDFFFEFAECLTKRIKELEENQKQMCEEYCPKLNKIKDKEIEFQKDINKTEKDRHKKTEKSLKGQIIKNNKIIEKLEKEAQKYFEEIIKQDRVMDLMAETIRKLAISLANYRGSYNEETFNFTGNIKDIKQYYESKAINDG